METTETPNKLFLAIVKFGLQLQTLETVNGWSGEEFKEAHRKFLGELTNSSPTKTEEQVIKILCERAEHLAKRKGISL